MKKLMTARLFTPKPNMLIELDRLEQLFPNSKEQLLLFSNTIRNKVWGISNEPILAAHLYACNRVFGIIGDILNEESCVLTQYIEYLKLNAQSYCGKTLDGVYEPLLLKIHEMYTRDIIAMQWRKINPYYACDFSPDELEKEKNILSILDDFYEAISSVTADIFLKPLYSFEDEYALVRGRRKKWSEKSDLAAPPIEVAEEKKIKNRWTPDGKRYLYLAVGDSITAKETALAEMRAKEGEEFTVGQFKVMNYAKKRTIVYLDFEPISRADIFSRLEKSKNQIVNEIVDGFKSFGRIPAEKEIWKKIESKRAETEKAVKIFTGQLLLKEIGDVIFVPLDMDEDTDDEKKDRCYKSFHMLAEYFEDKGYAGIAYPSTRMKLQRKSGENLVLFDANSAEAREETMETVIVVHE